MRSIVVPGWGQIATPRRTVGRALVFSTGLAGIATLTVFLFVEPVEIVAWLANPDVILGIILANVAILLVRLLSTEHAWRYRGGSRWFVAIFLGMIVSIPHVAIGWVGIETRSAMTSVFSEPALVAAPAETTTTSTSSTTTTTAPIELSPIVTTPGQYVADVIDAAKAAPWEPFGRERLNILLLGGDAGPGRVGLRTDTMMVASIDPITGDSVLVGVPRNFGGVTLTDGSEIPVTQLGHVYGWGSRHAERFPGPDPGAAAVRDVIANITGLEIDHYVLVDLTGFADVVDAFGGVTLQVTEAIDGPLYDTTTGSYEMVNIPVGLQHLDGAHALAYSRARYGSTDYARMGRQRCVLATMASQADLLTLFGRLGDLLASIEANVDTDLPADSIPDLIRLTPRIDAATIRMIGFDPTWGTGSTSAGRAVPDLERIREAVRRVIEDPDSASELGATTADAGC
ncbi:MAG TPA: LCP family protein [Acidimicrobiia bacterium]|nr:LCP family protein [Acidimicrobiia bacterium]